jgi:hypothetical protein
LGKSLSLGLTLLSSLIATLIITTNKEASFGAPPSGIKTPTAAASTNPASKPAAAAVKVRTIELKSWLQGRCFISFDKTSLRMESPERNFVLLLKAPEWKAICYNPRLKLIYVGEAKSFIPDDVKTAGWMRPSSPAELIPTSYKKVTFEGMNCTTYQLTSHNKFKVNNDRTWQRLLLRDGTYTVTELKTYPEAAVKALERAMGMPPVGGVPVKMEVKNYGNEQRDELKVLSVSMRTVGPDHFAVPKNFKSVKILRELGGQTANDPEVFEIMR